MNETLQTIHKLRSIREFSDKEISQEDLDKILDASIRAANASARQNYSIIVVDDPEILQKLFYGANKGLLFCVDYTRIVDTGHHLNYSYAPNNIQEFITGSVDTTLAAQTAAIAAKSLGIDSLFTNSIIRESIPAIYELFNLPQEYCFPLIALCLGYPKTEPLIKKGRLKTGVVHDNKHHRLTSDDANSIREQYADESNNLGITKEQAEKAGVKDYFEFFFTRWSRPRNPERIAEIYNLLKLAQFLRKED